MAGRPTILIRLLTPLLYVAATIGVLFVTDAVTGYIRVGRPSVYESLAESSWGVLVLFGGLSLLLLAGVTLLLLRLERQARPSIWDHFRQSALWYVFGILHWSAILEHSAPGTMDILIGLLPVTAVLANGLVMGAVRSGAIRR